MAQTTWVQVMRYIERGILSPAEARDMAREGGVTLTAAQEAELREYE